MNRRTFIVSLLILVVGMLLAFWLWPHAEPVPLSKATSVVAVSSPPPATTSVPATTPSVPAVDIPNIPGHPLSNQDKRSITTIFQVFSAPISFWGKVIDQDKQPVEGASVHYEAADKYFANGSVYSGSSDQNGLFSITGIGGAGLYVRVSKDGYYQLGNKSMRGFDNGSNEMPTQDHPAIFELRKRGQAEPLIVGGAGGGIAKDGTPIYINLSTGKKFATYNGDIEIQTWTNDASVPLYSGQHYDWRCKITVLNGGLQLRTGDEFNFVAPTDGYQPNDEIVMPANADQWRQRAQRKYFLHLANGDYARIDFDMMTGGDHIFSVVSYLNPTPGHTNLEYDPEQQASR